MDSIKGNQKRYPDKRLLTYQDFLTDLSKKAERNYLSETFQKAGHTELRNAKEIINFIESATLFLEDSILNTIPFEMVFCLQKALMEWVDEEEYVIASSLQYNKYSFTNLLSLNNTLFRRIKKDFNLEVHNKLIQISIPKHEVHNYLFCVVLYHELGHFVDMKNGISESILYEMGVPDNHDEYKSALKHWRERFADLFAAQYIGKAATQYLSYAAFEKNDSSTHPSTIERIKLIDDFLNKKDNCFIETIREATKLTIDKEICIRFETFDEADFYNLIPSELTNYKQLHGLFSVAWDIWMDESKIKKFNGFKLEQIYTILNNLIEKTISNYMVLNAWNNHKTLENVSDEQRD